MESPPALDGVDAAVLLPLLQRYKQDPDSVYNTWFIGGENRLKAFRSIRKGVRDVVDSIYRGGFGNDFKGSPLEIVLTAITEQKQVFEGAAHPFYWKPKLRIPDIYENETHKRLFATFLETCLKSTQEASLLEAFHQLEQAQIKGLGPAVASIVYFLHPTLIPPFNTAIVNGFNLLTGAKMKLGSWPSYFSMRETQLALNTQLRPELSKDLGALAGLLFEVGSGRLGVETLAGVQLAKTHAQVEKLHQQWRKAAQQEQAESFEHTHIQFLLLKIGRALGYDVFVARNDRHRSWDGHSFSQLTRPALPALGCSPEVADTISLIDVLWLNQERIVSAFEIEKSTSIYSGMLRLADLASSLPGQADLYLLAPDARAKDVRVQFSRPALAQTRAAHELAFIPFSALVQHCESLCLFGQDCSALRRLVQEGQ